MTSMFARMPLNALAISAVDDLNEFYKDRTRAVDSVTELAARLHAAANPIGLPSERTPILEALSRSGNQGRGLEIERTPEYATWLADGLIEAVKTQPPEENYKYLMQCCLRLADAAKPTLRAAPSPGAKLS